MVSKVESTAIRSDDFSREQVPQDKTHSGFHIALIMIGGTIAIPVFLMSAQIGSSLGMSGAIPAFFLASLILGVLVGFTSYVGAKTHYSTYMITEFAFGRYGAKFVNFIIALTLVGWYGVVSSVFAEVADSLVQDTMGVVVPVWAYVIIGSVLMVAVTVSGFQGLDKLAVALVPLMVIFLVYTAIQAYEGDKIWSYVGKEGVFSFSTAVSAIIGSYIVGVVIQPDYSRFARNTRHAIVAAFLALGISFPLVMILCAIPSISTGNGDLIQIMVILGVGAPAFLLLLLSSWSSNVLSLYSSSLSIATLIDNVRLSLIVVGVGCVGTLIAVLGAQDFFVNYLILLGITIPPVASVYIINVLWVRKGICDADILSKEPRVSLPAFFAWAAAILVGYWSHTGYLSVTQVAGLDSILTASIIYPMLSRRSRV